MVCSHSTVDLFVKGDNFNTKDHSVGFNCTQACFPGLTGGLSSEEELHSQGIAKSKATI